VVGVYRWLIRRWLRGGGAMAAGRGLVEGRGLWRAGAGASPGLVASRGWWRAGVVHRRMTAWQRYVPELPR